MKSCGRGGAWGAVHVGTGSASQATAHGLLAASHVAPSWHLRACEAAHHASIPTADLSRTPSTHA